MATHVEPGYTPVTFFLARSKDKLVIAELASIYVLLSILLSTIVFVGYGKAISLISFLTVLGLSGSVLAVLVLFLSTAIDRYTLTRYQRTYLTKFKLAHQGMTDPEVNDMLAAFYATLKERTKSVLKVDIGATLTAVSTVLSLIGIIAKGV